MSRYTVTITLGDDDAYAAETWVLEHQLRPATGRVQVTDGVRVLDGLRFGWAIPDSSVWPLQPAPMTANLALTMPDFDDEPWMGEGCPVAITVAILGATRFAFYGRLTDATAAPRDGRPGVTLSLTAVDYTVDPVEFGTGIVISSGGPDEEVLENLWTTLVAFGDFPGWPTTPAAVLVKPNDNARATIDEVLLSAVAEVDLPAGWEGSGPKLARPVFAPLIDPLTGLQPAAGARWAFDLVWGQPFAPRLTIDGRLERASFTWARNKRTPPSQVTVIGAILIGESEPFATHTETAPYGARPWGPEVTATLESVTTDADRLEDVASFYLPANPARGWAIPTVRWLLTHSTDDVLADLPGDLMPRWDLSQGQPQRSSCYQRYVELVNVADDKNPYSATDAPEIVAPVVGCQLVIQGGHIALDFTLRHLLESA